MDQFPSMVEANKFIAMLETTNSEDGRTEETQGTENFDIQRFNCQNNC